jgi:CelD/BcsL family acetyltransferase involved in cellulose biosynthesis
LDVDILDVDDPAWQAFVESRPEATPFHLPAWSHVIGRSYGFRPFAFVTRAADGTVTGGLPVVELGRRRRWTSLPFTDQCDPLVPADGLGDLLEALELERRRRGVPSVVIRSEAGLSQSLCTGGWRHVLSLDAPPDELFRRFDRSQVQRAIRKSERERTRVRIADRREDLTETFYGLHLSTRRRLGVPVQPRAFFDRLWEEMIAKELGTVFVVEVGSVPCGAGVFLTWKDKVVYKFGASEQHMWSHRPNHALFWHAIQWACERGATSFDFGRTDVDNEGLRSFKARWGTTESMLHYSVFGAAPPARMNGLASRALSSLIRHSPEFVCRQVGEHLYRHAA